jgi:hypothetical protein
MDIRITETRYKGGFVEIGAYQQDKLVGCITHPCADAKWFVHFMGCKPKVKAKTRQTAIDILFADIKEEA